MISRVVAAAIAGGLVFTGAIALAQAQPPVSQSVIESAGFSLYQRYCAVCHDGGDELAPSVARLNELGHDEIMSVMAPGGIMEGQASAMSEAERAQVAAFIMADTDRRARLMAAAENVEPEVAARFAYPVRRIRDPRDSANIPRLRAWAAPPLTQDVYEFESWEQPRLRAVVVARGLSSPRAIEFLPNGDILVAERAGALRIIRDGVLDPNPVPGTPDVAVLGTGSGFSDVMLHPDFEENGIIYLSYHKPVFDTLASNAVMRARWENGAIVDGEDIFVSDDVDMLASRLLFGPDGKLYVTMSSPGVGTDESIGRAQITTDYAGTTLRLNEDGSVPEDNPFVGREGFNPEIYTYGHRVNIGLTQRPGTNELWVSEHGPNGGDELNVLERGANYGWPIINHGNYYSGNKVSPVPGAEGFTQPRIAFLPSIAPGNLIFYTGDKFPEWQGDILVGSMRLGQAPRTGHLQRIVVNENGGHVRSEMLLFELGQRIREVEQGPDGYVWITTDEGADSVLMRLEPVAEE
jgi:glucose/arabinose dehydrogenase/cytochrome c553